MNVLRIVPMAATIPRPGTEITLSTASMEEAGCHAWTTDRAVGFLRQPASAEGQQNQEKTPYGEVRLASSELLDSAPSTEEAQQKRENGCGNAAVIAKRRRVF